MNDNPLSTIPSQTIQNDDEIDLFEQLSQFLSVWRWWVSGAILGGLLGLAAAFLIPPKYQAQGIVRLAQAAQLGGGQEEAKILSSPVESMGEAIARSQTFAFKGDVVNRLIAQKLLPQEQRDIWTNTLLDSAISMRPTKDAVLLKDNTSLLEIKATARNKDLVKGMVEALAQTLAEHHQSMVNERTALLKKSLEQNRTVLLLMEKRYGSAINYLKQANMIEVSAYASMRQRTLALEAALQPPATRPTELMVAVAASDRPVSPKKALLLAAGLVAGGFIGAALGMGLPAWRRYQAQRKLPA